MGEQPGRALRELLRGIQTGATPPSGIMATLGIRLVGTKAILRAPR